MLELGLHANDQQMILITTSRLDAVLHEPPPERTKHTIGRPRVGGFRLPALEQILQDQETVWQKLTLDWYSEGKRTDGGSAREQHYGIAMALTLYPSGGC